MKIQSYSVSLAGDSSHIETQSEKKSIRAWVGGESQISGGSEPQTLKALTNQDTLELSEEGIAKNASMLTSVEDIDEAELAGVKLTEKERLKILAIQRMIEILTGKKIKFVLPEIIKLKRLEELKENLSIIALERLPSSQGKGWGVEYNHQRIQTEQQHMSFSADGVVKTSDGREIKIDLKLNVHRAFTSVDSLSFRSGDAVRIDPLVINFDSATAVLTEEKISFDLDSDGQSDQISFVKKGSGFLALDLNEDGIINNGTELFGPKSGDGFEDLSVYDFDGNNWIDENDSIYDKLRIWTKDDNGNDTLFALGQKGIGAIFLGNIETNYKLKDSSNELRGEIKKSGIFLTEEGVARTIQHVDLMI